MIYLYNNELKKISIIGKDDLREFTTTEELNSQWIVEISYPFSLHKKEAEYVGFKDNNEFKLYKIINTSRSDDFIDINGVHIFFHDLKGKVIRDVRPSNKTALQVATEILTDTDWEVFSTAKGLNSTNFYYISKLDAFYDLLEKWQCEFRLETYFDGDKFTKKIYLQDHISKDYGRWFEYGDKLLTVVAEENHFNVFTAFIGRGKGEETGDGYGRKIKFDSIAWSVENGNPINKPLGQDYVEIKEATKLYGYPDGNPRTTVVDFDDEEDRENLLKLTYEYALENSRPKLQLKATAVDDNKAELGEVCAIVRPNLDIRYKTRIFKVKTDRLSDLQEFEFGDKIVISRSDRIRAEQKTKEKEFQEIESRLEQALKNIDIDYRNEDGYNYDLKAGNKYNLPAGVYSFDKPIDEDPTKVVYMGAGKVLIADEKGSDGNWKWKTALDGNGIAGSSIVAHSITANQLAADVGQSLDLSSNESIKLTVTSTTQDYIDQNKDQLKGEDGGFIKGDKAPTDTTKIWFDTTDRLFKSFVGGEWEPIPNDELLVKINGINVQLTEYGTSIEALNQEINLQVEKTETNGEYIRQVETKLQVLEDGVESSFSSYLEQIENNEKQITELKGFMRSGLDNDGNVYTEWRSDPSADSYAKFGTGGIALISAGEETFTVEDGIASATSLFVQDKIGYGNHTAQKYGTSFTIFIPNQGGGN